MPPRPRPRGAHMGRFFLAEEDGAAADTGLGLVICNHFRGLLEHLATLTRNTAQVQGSEHAFEQLTVPAELQRTAFELLQVKLAV